MSDRLAVMAGGQIAQIGSPEDVYEQPADAYVADFLGISNLMEATVTRHGQGCCYIQLGEFELTAGCGAIDATGAVKIAVRPERVHLEPFDATGVTRVPAMVERLVFLGSATQVIVRLAPGARVQALVHNDGEPLAYEQGTPLQVYLPPEAVRVLPERNIIAGSSGIDEDGLAPEPGSFDLAAAVGSGAPHLPGE